MNREPSQPEDRGTFRCARERSRGQYWYRYEVTLPGSGRGLTCSAEIRPYDGHHPSVTRAEQRAIRREALGQILTCIVATTKADLDHGTWHAIAAIGWDPPEVDPYRWWGNTDNGNADGPVDKPFESLSLNNTGYLWLQFSGSAMYGQPKRLRWNKLNQFLKGRYGDWDFGPEGPLARHHELAYYSSNTPMLEVREGLLGQRAQLFHSEGVLPYRTAAPDACLNPDQIFQAIPRPRLEEEAEQRGLYLPRYFR